jgi:hypothetical protein
MKEQGSNLINHIQRYLAIYMLIGTLFVSWFLLKAEVGLLAYRTNVLEAGHIEDLATYKEIQDTLQSIRLDIRDLQKDIEYIKQRI